MQNKKQFSQTSYKCNNKIYPTFAFHKIWTPRSIQTGAYAVFYCFNFLCIISIWSRLSIRRKLVSGYTVIINLLAQLRIGLVWLYIYPGGYWLADHWKMKLFILADWLFICVFCYKHYILLYWITLKAIAFFQRGPGFLKIRHFLTLYCGVPLG
jgi:hypothetical protein